MEEVPSAVRCKMRVTGNRSSRGEGIAEITLNAVFDDNPDSENGKFFQATPSGEIRFSVVKPEVAARFEIGKDYYVDFTKCSEQDEE